MGPETAFSHLEKTVIEHMKLPMAVFLFSGSTIRVLALSDGFCSLLGNGERGEMLSQLNRSLFHNVHPDDRIRLFEEIRRFGLEGGRFDTVYRHKESDRFGWRIIHAFFEQVSDTKDGKIVQAYFADEGIYQDEPNDRPADLNQSISAALRQSDLERTVRYDDLTGLPGVFYFFQTVDEEKKKIRETGGIPVFLYFDFIGMKFYNSRYGFSDGDRLLQSFAELLSELFGKTRSCRVETDHFAVLTEDKVLDAKLKKLCEDYHAMTENKRLPLHAGVYAEESEDADSRVSCDRARLACRALKGRYDTEVNYYSRDLSKEAEERQYFIENLDRAIEERWIQVYYQPIIRAVSGQICDVEALARWKDPSRGMISPAEFIPALEDAGLIWRLDLCMVERVLELINIQKSRGLFIIPHSVNLSRADFDACDIVEEIRRRVDEAGVERSRITIELTESVIGSDFEFMKEQVMRFRELGFPVWMDDFGSGYSSLDVLQSIPFDLIKFDMSFLRRLDEGNNGKIILTELMRMASALGLDTVCEGVETAEQVSFLQEIGCSKLQGYYFGRPIPFEAIHEMEENRTLIETELPQTSEYYESLSRTNLYDFRAFAGEEDGDFQNVFDTLPAAILEIHEDKGRFLRYNHSYQEFVQRYFSDNVRSAFDLNAFDVEAAAPYFRFLGEYLRGTAHPFFNHTLPDGTVIHCYVRRIAVNPISGSTAVSSIILSVSDPNDNTTFADIAQTLAADYYNIYVIDLDTGNYTEYTSVIGEEEITVSRRGADFFASAKRESEARIYEKDREEFLTRFTKENVLQALESQGVFTITYRLMDTGTPMYVSMKITRMRSSSRIIAGISVIDSQMKQLEEEKKLRQERLLLGRISALSPEFVVLYTIDPETGAYTQIQPSPEFQQFALASQGEDFFGDVVRDAPGAIAPEDMERHLRVMTRENMLKVLEEERFLIHRYRLMIDGTPVPVRLKASFVNENGSRIIILGVTKE